MSTVRIVALALLAGLAAPRAAEPDEQVKAAFAAWDAAFNGRDAKAIGAFYTPDATFLPPTHEVLTGPEGVARFFDGILAQGVTDHHLELIRAEGDGRLVAAAARWTVRGKDEKGAPATFSGFGTAIFERQADGGLKLKMHSFN
jgi:uncharacterized protein (TIGR02246 family)